MGDCLSGSPPVRALTIRYLAATTCEPGGGTIRAGRVVNCGRLLPVLLAFAALAVTVSVTSASADGSHHRSDRVQSKDDAAKAKLSADLQQKVEDRATDKVTVVVSVQSPDVPQASQIMDDTHVASENGAALVVGTVNATKLSKLASIKGVVSVTSIQFRQTGTPTGDDPEVGNQHDRRTQNEALRAFQKSSVPFDKAPPLKTSNFDQLKSMNVLDAKTHNFTGAWKAGYTGTGVTASVLDGGTDWGHPDLVGTWQTWTQDDVTSRRADPGWVGWPKAFDPYGTLVMLAAPTLIDQGLTWYTKTQTATCTYVKKNGKPADRNDRNALCSVSFATQTGPARNFSAPAGTNTHTYTFPASWTKSGTVKLGSHPDEYLLQLYGERPAVLVTDPNTAGAYDTVYVDLSDDYGHEELARLLPRPERRRLHRPLGRPPLLHLGRPDEDPGWPHQLRHQYEARGGRLPGVVGRLRSRDRGARDADRVERRRSGRDQRQGSRLRRHPHAARRQGLVTRRRSPRQR